MDPIAAARMAWAVISNRWAQLALGVAVAYAVGHHHGYAAKADQDAKAALRQANAVIVQTVKTDNAIAVVNHATAALMAHTTDTTTTNLTRVRAYVTPKADADCVVSTGAVRLLDYAARDVPAPAAPGDLRDAPSDVALSDIVEADIVNAGNFNKLRERVAGWESWYALLPGVVPPAPAVLLQPEASDTTASPPQEPPA